MHGQTTLEALIYAPLPVFGGIAAGKASIRFHVSVLINWRVFVPAPMRTFPSA